ncbi:MAG: hypothetical protein HQK96_09735 [Nitrospirae bacterium]|nr:hypothetical protein [Nitrospirota bacterium]MBF0554817.1 hypothetical protein [Nitrospirota bacterium]
MKKAVPVNTNIIGDSAIALEEMDSRSVELVGTTPPYFFLRNYAAEFIENVFCFEEGIVESEQILFKGDIV